jgi:SOS-response transcriptional repressor LexA
MAKFDEKAVIQRIIQVRADIAGVRGKSKFAKALGLSPSTYNYYEQDRLAPVPILLKICEITGVDLYWLLTGSQEREETSLQQYPKLVKLLSSFLQKNPASVGMIETFIELLDEKTVAEQEHTTRQTSQKSIQSSWIPILGRTAAGVIHLWQQSDLPNSEEVVTKLESLIEKHTDSPVMQSRIGRMSVDFQAKPIFKTLESLQANLVQINPSEDDEIVQFVESEEIHSIFPDCFALQIDGDSMSPRINDGDIVILSPSVPAAQGHIAVASVAGQIGVTCKIIRTTDDGVHFIPINERYETKVVPQKDLVWALSVLCHIKLG